MPIIILKSHVADYDKKDGTHVAGHERRPTYVHRKVLNGRDIHAWAVKAGFKDVVPGDKMHVTVAYSKTPMDQGAIKRDGAEHVLPAAGRKLDRFDGDKATVLRLESDHLHGRFKHMLSAGASWDFRHTRPQYKPHLTISYNPEQDVDHRQVPGYDGPVHLGPEVVEDLKTNWSATLAKAHIKAHTRRLASGKVVPVAAHTDKRPTAHGDHDGQLALFSRPQAAPAGPNPFKGKDPVKDTPDLFDGLTPRERAPAAPAPAPAEPPKPAKPHPLQASADRLAEHRADADAKRAAGDAGMAEFYDMLAGYAQEEHDKLATAFAHFDKHGDGLELSRKDGKQHVVFLPDASNPGKYRYQIFDSRGMMSHATHDSPEEAVAEAARDGYTEHNPGVLDRLASTEEWEEGMAINAVIQAVNSKLITWDEANKRHADIKAEFDARRAARAGHTLAIQAVAKRFGLTPAEVHNIVNTPVDELRRRDDYIAPSNTSSPTTDFERHPVGAAMVNKWGDPMNSYVHVMREFHPRELTPTEHESGIKQHQTYKDYVKWARDGSEPPPIQVFDGPGGKFNTSNRRRTLAAQEAGRKSIKGWYSMDNKETGNPLKLGDVLAAHREAQGAPMAKSYASAADLLKAGLLEPILAGVGRLDFGA